MRNKLFDLLHRNGVDNLNKSLLNPEVMLLLGPTIIDLFTENNIVIDAVGGLSPTASPIVTAISVSTSHLHQKLIHAFLIREDLKCHGINHTIEGFTKLGANVALVIPVLTNIEEVKYSIKIINEHKMNVGALVSIISEVKSNLIIPHLNLYTMKEFSCK